MPYVVLPSSHSPLHPKDKSATPFRAMASIVHLRIYEDHLDVIDDDPNFATILSPIKLKALAYTNVTTMAAATALFGGQARPTVLATDETLLNQDNWQLRDLAFNYLRSGGTIVLAPIASDATYIEEFVVKLGVPWTEDLVHSKRTFDVNPAFSHFDTSSIPQNRLKALYLIKVADEDSLLISPRNIPEADFDNDAKAYSYFIGEQARMREAIRAADLEGNYVAAALTKVGQGRVGYVAECYGRPEAVNVVLGMIGLL